MMFEKFSRLLVRVLSLAILSAGFGQVSWAGAIDTNTMIEADARIASIGRIEALFAEDDVSRQLQSLGVDKSDIDERLQGMTAAELVSLEGRIDHHVAGGDALSIVGAVFVVLVILELVGVTDIFNSF